MIRLSKAEAARLGLTTAVPAKRGPNKLEARYDAYLAALQAAGEIIEYRYEAIKLKIGVKRCWYTPDFYVVKTTGLEFHETKGFMREASRVMLQSAARQYPQFRFVLVRQDGDGWDWELIA